MHSWVCQRVVAGSRSCTCGPDAAQGSPTRLSNRFLPERPCFWPPPAEFWLHPADVMRFKAEVMRHLPILIYGDRTKLTESE